jgi:hypothetical protein
MLGRDLGVVEALRDPNVRAVLFAPIVAIAIAAVAAYGAINEATVVGTTFLVGAAFALSVFAVRWADEALCVLRAGHTCHTCRHESERWEVGE